MPKKSDPAMKALGLGRPPRHRARLLNLDDLFSPPPPEPRHSAGNEVCSPASSHGEPPVTLTPALPKPTAFLEPAVHGSSKTLVVTIMNVPENADLASVKILISDTKSAQATLPLDHEIEIDQGTVTVSAHCEPLPTPPPLATGPLYESDGRPFYEGTFGANVTGFVPEAFAYNHPVYEAAPTAANLGICVGKAPADPYGHSLHGKTNAFYLDDFAAGASARAQPAVDPSEDYFILNSDRFEQLANEVLAEDSEEAQLYPYLRRQSFPHPAESRCDACRTTNPFPMPCVSGCGRAAASFGSERSITPVESGTQADTAFFRGSLFDIPGTRQDRPSQPTFRLNDPFGLTAREEA